MRIITFFVQRVPSAALKRKNFACAPHGERPDRQEGIDINAKITSALQVSSTETSTDVCLPFLSLLVFLCLILSPCFCAFLWCTCGTCPSFSPFLSHSLYLSLCLSLVFFYPSWQLAPRVSPSLFPGLFSSSRSFTPAGRPRRWQNLGVDSRKACSALHRRESARDGSSRQDRVKPDLGDERDLPGPPLFAH